MKEFNNEEEMGLLELEGDFAFAHVLISLTGPRTMAELEETREHLTMVLDDFEECFEEDFNEASDYLMEFMGECQEKLIETYEILNAKF